MNREYLKLVNIYYKLLELYFILPFKYGFDKEKDKKINIEILNLYKEYLQILVNIQDPIPLLKNDNKLKNGSCYLYALGLSIPTIFKNVYEVLTDWQFGTDPGEISGYNPLENEWNEKEFLERIYADLDALKIKAYPSSLNASIKHNGYKIACFLDKDGKDFHFARQNLNGLWSQKRGFNKKVYKDINPEAFLYLSKDYNYELIETLEIVKPCIKR